MRIFKKNKSKTKQFDRLNGSDIRHLVMNGGGFDMDIKRVLSQLRRPTDKTLDEFEWKNK